MRLDFKFLILLILVLFSCRKENKETANTPQNNFKILWTDFKDNYPAFLFNNTNWDSVYNATYPSITPNISDKTFLDILNSTLLTLKDAHSFILQTQYENTSYYDIFTHQKPNNFISWHNIFTKYVQLYKTNNSNACLAYGKILNQDIGYFLVESFAENSNDYYLIDSFLDKFKSAKGIIIDIRQNPGGNSRNAEVIASRFTNQPMQYEFFRYRKNSNNYDLTDFQSATLQPDGLLKYNGTVVLLTNRHTFSAAENFALMLKSLPNVIQVGDTTFGGVATQPDFKMLPNGWKYAIPKQILYDNKKIPIKNGIAPNISVQINTLDSINGNDRIIEKAIELINETK